MVSITKKQIGNETYYYLGHTYRSNGKVNKTEKYLGKEIPKNIEQLKKDFIFEIYKEKWFKIFEKIKENYKKDQKLMPISAKEKELETFMIKFTYDTQRIEGSKLTLKDTANLLERGITPREKPIRDIKEAENHKQAFLYMKQQLKGDISKEFILELHRLLKNTVTEDAGKLRTGQGRVGTLIPIHAKLLETELDNLLEWYHNNKKDLHPLETASEFHSVFERLHPFFDGNGRVGRLLLNYILLKNKYPLLIVQNKNKRRYYTALKKADDGNILPMLKYLLFELQEQTKNW